MRVTRYEVSRRRDEFEAEEKGTRVRIAARRHGVLVDVFAAHFPPIQTECSLDELADALQGLHRLPERDFDLSH